MFNYKYKDSGLLSVSLHDDLRELAFIEYSLNESDLYISSIECNSIAKKIYNNNYHFGTDILNALLLHLVQLNFSLKTISGTLSIADAYNNNWLKSIPFYADFPNYLNQGLNYSIDFHLYDHDMNEVNFPRNYYDRIAFLNEFKKNHLELNKNAYFKYFFENERTQK